VKSRPILFSGPMVRAILDGRKTMTRRVVKPQPPTEVESVFRPFPSEPHNWQGYGDGVIHWYGLCPYGVPGDQLWVRETWARDDEDGALMYRADLGRNADADAWEQGRIEGVPRYRWRPSIHMPRRCSRITLEITGVRVERLQEISGEDAKAEGAQYYVGGEGLITETDLRIEPGFWHGAEGYRQGYAQLWGHINGLGSWDANPWTWVVEFRRVT
jgi:hypothetical protein